MFGALLFSFADALLLLLPRKAADAGECEAPANSRLQQQSAAACGALRSAPGSVCARASTRRAACYSCSRSVCPRWHDSRRSGPHAAPLGFPQRARGGACHEGPAGSTPRSAQPLSAAGCVAHPRRPSGSAPVAQPLMGRAPAPHRLHTELLAPCRSRCGGLRGAPSVHAPCQVFFVRPPQLRLKLLRTRLEVMFSHTTRPLEVGALVLCGLAPDDVQGRTTRGL